jgi:hypothetical protein
VRPASAGVGSGSSINASRTIRRGSYWRGSNCRQLTSSNSGPICSFSWDRALVASVRTCRTMPASLPAYSGSRSGPRTRMPTTMRRISSHPFTSNISSSLPPAQLEADCNVMLTSIVCAPRCTFIVTVSPTLRARMATMSESASCTFLPSNSTMTSPS